MPGEWPDPRTATDAGAFVEAMRQVRIRTGYSYRALERRAEQAGLVLPSSTISAALARDRLPRAELVDAFLQAAGADAETTERWLAVRADLAVGTETPAEPAAEESKPERRRLGYALVALAAVAVIAVVIVVMTTGSDPERPAAQPPPASEMAPSLPPAQPIRVAHTQMCVGEGPELTEGSDREVFGQHPCDLAFPPISLERLPGDQVRVHLQHPDKGPGCLTVDRGGTYSEVLLAGGDCENGRPDQTFTLEPVDGGYRMHSVAGARWCIGVMAARTDPGVQLMQGECTGGREQVFQTDGA
ncbi:RICIN domain-containing protein [Amycolatopsis sp. 195334CR]|uniref:RICIN domain-containing protein n=1 Tax=Amycolatopsis sp. 195334CR TaxID=2814588 RepID=UPI001A90498A|nr:RICIN domain-containing protein [Amycolatopsis sp. 195334CR]MBN6035493.1 RICIN domain-containing protein [Amycolatopsis sp. 195334CR]